VSSTVSAPTVNGAAEMQRRQALGGAVGALAVGVGEHHQELVGLPADDHVAAAQRAGEAGAGVVEDGGGGLGRERGEAVEPGLDERERVAVAGGAGDEEVRARARRGGGCRGRSPGR
jgi:hypothetical protein